MLSTRSSSLTLVINTSTKQSKPLHNRRSLSKPLQPLSSSNTSAIAHIITTRKPSECIRFRVSVK